MTHTEFFSSPHVYHNERRDRDWKTTMSVSADHKHKQMKQACEVVVRRVLCASQVLLDASKVKTLKPEHIKLLAKMNPQPTGVTASSSSKSPPASSPKKNKTSKGGSSDHHLPSEYFGVPSGQYSSASRSPLDHTVFTSSPHLARHRLDATLPQGGGATHADPVSLESVSACVDKYSKKGVTVPDETKKLVRAIVSDTLSPSTTAKQAETIAIKWASLHKKSN